jgi:hypothetical protein
MSDNEKRRDKDTDPEMRRGVSRRGFITNELSRATMKAAKQLPGIGGMLGMAIRETPSQRDERLVGNLWQLLMGRTPKPQESAASLELVRNAKTADEKGDALVDIVWALTQTKEFEDLNRSNGMMVRGFYRLALDRDPTEEERNAALEIMSEATEPGARVAALEGLFTGLIRSWESVLRKDPARR